MDIALQLAFDEGTSLITLNVLAQHDAKVYRQYDLAAAREGRESLEPLYEAGIVYEPEKGEIWGDVLNTMMEGHEDCDALAAIRAGELMARGAFALHPGDPNDPVKYPGDGGYIDAIEWGMTSIPAEVMLKTNSVDGRPGLYHCITRYWVPDAAGFWREYRDDPSARLGMGGGSAESQQGLSGSRLVGRTVTPGGGSATFQRGIAMAGGLDVRAQQGNRAGRRQPAARPVLPQRTKDSSGQQRRMKLPGPAPRGGQDSTGPGRAVRAREG